MLKYGQPGYFLQPPQDQKVQLELDMQIVSLSQILVSNLQMNLYKTQPFTMCDSLLSELAGLN